MFPLTVRVYSPPHSGLVFSAVLSRISYTLGAPTSDFVVWPSPGGRSDASGYFAGNLSPVAAPWLKSWNFRVCARVNVGCVYVRVDAGLLCAHVSSLKASVYGVCECIE